MRVVFEVVGGLVFERCIERGVGSLWLFLDGLGVYSVLQVKIVLLGVGILVVV